MTITADDLRYPVGRLVPVLPGTPDIRAAALNDIRQLPQRLREAVAGLTDRQLDTRYREGGWTVRQVVHHVADSHMNGFLRTKLALSEDHPTIKPYDENAFSTLPDMTLPVDVSLRLVDALHERWAAVLATLDEPLLARTYFHPEAGEAHSLDRQLQIYGWHSRHHVAHITELRRRQGW